MQRNSLREIFIIIEFTFYLVPSTDRGRNRKGDRP